MIRAASVGSRYCRRLEIAKRLQPLSKDRTHRLVPLQVHAPNSPGAIVEIVISRQLVVLSAARNLWRGASHDHPHETSILRIICWGAEMLRDVSSRSE